MPFKPPPPSAKQQKNQQAAINNLLSRYPGLKQWMGQIRQASARWGIDPVYVLATLAVEKPDGNPNVTNSSGARGLAQIVDPNVRQDVNRQQYSTFIRQFAPDGKITTARAYNPTFAINYLAWRMAGHIRQYGSLDAAYDRGYNPGFSGLEGKQKGPNDLIPSWYFGIAKQPPAPIDTAGKAQDVAAAKAYLLQGAYFLQTWHNTIDPTYEAYTGRRATRAEAQQVIKNGWSTYHLQVQLSKTKAFLNSPVWKQNAPGYEGVYQSIYGDRQPAKDLLRYAIIHNLGQSGFQTMLRNGDGYVKSQEFQQNAETMRNVYRQIFGNPDDQAEGVIKQATLNGWNQDQFASYLRAQPEYSQSQEFQSKFADLRANFGGVQTKTFEQAMAPQPKLDTRNVPTDKRLPAAK